MALNPQVLTWARDTAGLSVDEAARALGFKDSQSRTAVERLEAIETGNENPSPGVLSKMARKYHRSLLVLYLREPPRIGDRGQDFRKAPGGTALEYDPTLDALIRDIRGRQSIVKDLLEQADTRKIDYVGSATMETPAPELAHRIMARLGFSRDEFRQQKNVSSAFAYLRERVEASGAFVLLLGNLGSHHSNIPSRVFRGYAIADPIAPFIVVNDQDAPIAWAFTTLHELTHLWLGATGISGATTDAQLESYCNSVSSEILLPLGEMDELRSLRGASLSRMVDLIDRFASSRKISRSMVAYRLLRIGTITTSTWRDLDRHYEDEWVASQARAASAEAAEGGPNYYVLKRHRLGHTLVDLVRNSVSEGLLSYTRAGQILGVKPRNVDPLIHALGSRGGQ